MASIVYRCPTTGQKIESWLADDAPGGDQTYVVLRCSACERAPHQSIRCQHTGRRLESALADVLMDKFVARCARGGRHPTRSVAMPALRARRWSASSLPRHSLNFSCSVVRAAIMSTKSKNTHEGRLIEIKTRLYPVLYEDWGLRR